MKITNDSPDTLEVTDVTELSGSGAGTLRDTIRKALRDQHQTLNLDLSGITFIDSSGLGALIALNKTLVGRGGRVQLVNSSPIAKQILELTRLHRVFEMITR
jgi:anti-anti-sigma factor